MGGEADGDGRVLDPRLSQATNESEKAQTSPNGEAGEGLSEGTDPALITQAEDHPIQREAEHSLSDQSTKSKFAAGALDRGKCETNQCPDDLSYDETDGFKPGFA